MFTGTLYPYQLEGLDAVVERRKILVAYSMGTGKTVLTIAALEQLLGDGEIRNVLILVPASVKWQWAVAIAEFTDIHRRTVNLRGTELVVGAEEMCMVIHGTAKQRAEQWAYVGLTNPDYVIASVSAVRHDWEAITRTLFDALVLDEATVIKHFSAQVTKKIKLLKPRTRIALSGTPAENRPEEIFSIMEWVDGNVLGRWDLFDKSYITRNYFGAVTGYKNLDLMNRRLQRAMIRKSRLDPDVAKYLPDVVEVTRTVTLPAPTRRLYDRILRDLSTALEELGEAGATVDLAAYYAGIPNREDHSAQGQVMARILAARLLLDDPRLLMDSAVAYHEDRGEGSEYIAALVASLPTGVDQLAAPKLDELLRQLSAMLAEPGAKAAVFTCYRRMLPYIVERLAARGIGYTEYHGGLSAEEKAHSKARFDTDEDCRVFVSTNAGGYGLDLPRAQYLINYDLPDSRGVYDQRNTRHVRASSTYEKVYVLNLVVEESLEERQLATLSVRGEIAAAIVDGIGGGTVKLDMETLSEHVGRVI